MPAFAPPVRTDSHPLDNATFQELMAEHMRRAPWVALSAVLHAVAMLVLWLLIPPEAADKPRNFVEIAAAAQPAPIEPEPLKPPEPLPEPELPPDPIVTDLQPSPSDQPAEFPSEDSSHSTSDSAIDSPSWTNPIGLIGAGKPGPYGKRGQPGGGGGGGPTGVSRDAALQWLKNHQDEDGKWDCDGFNKHDDPSSDACDGPGNATHDVGVTGLALLAFLGDGSTMRSGPYKDTIKKGVNWLRTQQGEDGLFGQPTSHDFVYDHAIAAYAMCEAFGLSGYETLKPYAQKGINYLEKHRNPYSVWRYQPRDNDNDTSITGWAIMAYESGEFFKLTINKEALKLCAQWLDQVSDPSGRHGYSKQGEPSSRKPGEHGTRFPVEKGEAMTAVGLFCRFFMGQDPKEKPIMKAAADLILSKPPIWDEKAGTIDHYYWYYATYALFQMGGTHWTAWQKKLEAAVVKNQNLDKAKKNLYGSWNPTCAWGEDGGRVYSTAILALTLQANSRYTRLVR